MLPPRKHRKRAKHIQKLIGRVLGDYILRLTPETLDMVDERLRRAVGPKRLSSLFPLDWLYVNPSLTKAYVYGIDPKRGTPVLRKLRWLRWFLCRPRALKMAPGGGRV